LCVVKGQQIIRILIFLLLLLIPYKFCLSAEIVVAVASNFYKPLLKLKATFEETSKHKVIVVSGSSGKLFAQINQGAPFDIFLSADIERAKQLEINGVAIKGSRFTYAYGVLVLWSNNTKIYPVNGAIAHQNNWQNIAIANPQFAPYGKAASDFIEAKKLNLEKGRIVFTENISQTFHLVSSGASDLGLVAMSQIIDQNIINNSPESYWAIPANLHRPIEQQAILIKSTPAAIQLIDFLKSSKAQGMIKRMGYLTNLRLMNRYDRAVN
jgi:molybdate transport system substrate-binding protein